MIKRCNTTLTKLSTALLMLAPAGAIAMPGSLPSGGNLISKGAYTGFFNPSFSHNPAMLPVALGERSIALGGVHLPAFAVEIGEVDNLGDRFDALEEALDNAESPGSEEGEDVSAAEANAIKTEFDAFVAELNDDAYVGLDVNLPVPVLPVTFKAFGGVMSVYAEASVGAQINAYGDELVYDAATKEISTDTAVYVRSGEFIRLGVSYGKTLMPLEFAGGQYDLNIGGTLSLTKASLSRQVIGVDDNESEDDSAFDRAEENYDKNKEDTTALGLDVGVAMVSEKAHFGATLRNLIPQEFDYADLGKDCASKTDPEEQFDCEAAAAQIANGNVSASDSYELDPQLMLEGSYMVHQSGLRIFGSLEANEVENVAGKEYQWATAGIGFVGPWWAPGIELAYHSNLAGEKIDMFALGVQLFKAVNLQLSVSPDKVENDGDSINRAAALSISFATSL